MLLESAGNCDPSPWRKTVIGEHEANMLREMESEDPVRLGESQHSVSRAWVSCFLFCHSLGLVGQLFL